MTAYLLSTSDSGVQNDCFQKLKSNGIEVIQVADGLCVKTTLPKEDLKKLSGLIPQPVDPSAPDLSEDILNFIR